MSVFLEGQDIRLAVDLNGLAVAGWLRLGLSTVFFFGEEKHMVRHPAFLYRVHELLTSALIDLSFLAWTSHWRGAR